MEPIVIHAAACLRVRCGVPEATVPSSLEQDSKRDCRNVKKMLLLSTQEIRK